MQQEQPIYLDNAATTRVDDAVAAVVQACMLEDFGNPSSAHSAGIAAETRIKRAREQVLNAIGDPAGQRGSLLWTSGGTESDALGVLGAARANHRRGHHILYSAIEHPAVRQSAAQLTREGWKVEAIPVSPDGVVETQSVLDRVTDETTVVAIMLVNNELGTINPISEIASGLERRNQPIHLHCDAVQALGKIPIDVASLGADSVAFAGHKLHAPKGIGALWVRTGAKLEPLWAGGGQQKGLRSGTYNVPGIAAFGAATSLAAEGLDERRARWREFEHALVTSAQGTGVGFIQNGANAPRAPHVVSLAFKGIPAEPLLHVLESRGVLVSAGSACAERSRAPSPVLQAIGLDQAYGTLRFSFGRHTTSEEIKKACSILHDAIASF